MSCSCSTSPTDTQNLEAEVNEKINNHPCYSESAHQHYSRIHVPVAPACNIQCNYCNRKYDCSNESRPGVTSKKLKPEEAVKKVLYVGGKINNLSVVGIAGPGDALANPKKTFETFRLLQEKAPDLKLCLSTNGLKIEQHIDEIVKYNIDHVTVTINTVDETGEIGSQIYPWVHWNHKKVRGTDGAKILLEQQLKGIKMLVDRGILVKANSVLIPNINDKDLPNVAKKLKEMGVFLHNIMPLLSSPEFGTKFGLDGVPSATDQQVMEAQEACGLNMKLMSHCRQCRADAVGLVGEDKSAEIEREDFVSLEFEELEALYDLEKRKEEQQKIEDWRKTLEKANERVKIEQASKMELSSTGETKLVAVTTKGHGLINMHFGSATEFLIYEVGDKAVKFVMHRKITSSYADSEMSVANMSDNYEEQNESRAKKILEEIKITLGDCAILLTEKIGDCPTNELSKSDLIVDMSFAQYPIEKAVFDSAQKYFFNQEVTVSDEVCQ